MVPPVAVKHEHRRSPRRKLWLIQLTFRKYQKERNRMTYVRFRLLIPLNRCLVHVQDVLLKQQECLDFDIVWRRELKVRVRNRKVGRDRNVWPLNKIRKSEAGRTSRSEQNELKDERDALSRVPAGNALG